jgi:hypothetical protein
MRPGPFLGLLALLAPWPAFALSAGPVDGMTGAPGEFTCVECHISHPLNSGDGTFSLSGPPAWEAGQTYTITVSLQDPGQQRWGFEATQLGQGTFSLLEPLRTQLGAFDGREYVKHTLDGTSAGFPDGPSVWTFAWTAPEDTGAGTVTLYAAGNASNNSRDELGDYIYTTSLAIPVLLPPPAPVLDLAISRSPGSVTLDWTPTEWATSYQVYHRSLADQPWLPLESVPGPPVSYPAVAHTGFFQVTALN